MQEEIVQRSESTVSEIDGELVETVETATVLRPRAHPYRRACLVYLYLPVIFLTVALLGGVRISSADGSLIFLKPSLVSLIFAAMLVVLFARAGLIRFGEWFSEDAPLLSNAASGAVIASLYAASIQVFNSLIPEQGLPYWIIAFCFFWTLWNNIFAEFDTRRLLRSLGALFGLAFVVKYLVLLNLTAPANQGWVEGLLESPSRAAATWLLDIPAYSGGTEYIQFFALGLYMLGLYLLPASPAISSEAK